MTSSELSSHLRQLDRENLISSLIDGNGLPSTHGNFFLGMPAESVQISTGGKVGRANVIESIDFCDAVMARYKQHNGKTQPSILDFGCGWGRIIRAFLKETDCNRVTGADVRADILELARSLVPAIQFVLIDPRPPAMNFNNGAFDILVGYSVFSHLSEGVAQVWINEFARIIAPSGLLCITTRPRAHLVNAKRNAANVKNLDGANKNYATMLSDFDAAIAKYDSGEFVYVPTGGGGVLTSDFYGEAVIPRAYVENHWLKYFDLVDWIDKFSDIGSQPIIVLRRKS